MSFLGEQELKQVDAGCSRFASYDIWCGGISEKTYPCISRREVIEYKRALSICQPLAKVYDRKLSACRKAARSQLPGFSVEKGHWSWTNISYHKEEK